MVNLRDGGYVAGADRVLTDLARIRKDNEVFGDVLIQIGDRPAEEHESRMITQYVWELIVENCTGCGICLFLAPDSHGGTHVPPIPEAFRPYVGH